MGPQSVVSHHPRRFASRALARARHAPGRYPSSAPPKMWCNGWPALQFDQASPAGGISGLKCCQGPQRWRGLLVSGAGRLPLTRLRQDASALFAWARADASEACHSAQDVKISVVQPRLHHADCHPNRGPRHLCCQLPVKHRQYHPGAPRCDRPRIRRGKGPGWTRSLCAGSRMRKLARKLCVTLAVLGQQVNPNRARNSQV